MVATSYKGGGGVAPELLQEALTYARRRGAHFAEVYLETRLDRSITLEEGRIRAASGGTTLGAGVRAIRGSTVGYSHTSDLSRESLMEAVEAACSLFHASESSQAPVAIATERPSEAAEADALDLSLVRDLLFDLEQTARQAPKRISQVRASAAQSIKQVLVVNSEGLLKDSSEARARVSVEVVASADSGLQVGYDTLALRVPLAELASRDVQAVARRARDIAVAKLEARPAPSGRLPVVLAAGSGGILFHEACGHGLEADHVIKGASAFKGKLGERVAPEYVTLVDDATMAEFWGGLESDDEGNPGRRVVLIDSGVLVSYMVDRLRAPFFAATPSNGRRQSYKHPPMVRMTNTFLLPGKESPERLIEETRKGILVRKLAGGQVNTTTGDFVFGTMEAYLIEDGRVTAPLRDCNLTGNGPEVLASIEAVADDFDMSPGTCGKDGQLVPVGCGQPTLRVSSMTVGGTASEA
jgi:TldD protein